MNHSKQQFTKENTLGGQCNHPGLKRRNVVGLTAGHPLLVFYHLIVRPPVAGKTIDTGLILKALGEGKCKMSSESAFCREQLLYSNCGFTPQ
jgi:hypothetical protein